MATVRAGMLVGRAGDPQGFDVLVNLGDRGTEPLGDLLNRDPLMVLQVRHQREQAGEAIAGAAHRKASRKWAMTAS